MAATVAAQQLPAQPATLQRPSQSEATAPVSEPAATAPVSASASGPSGTALVATAAATQRVVEVALAAAVQVLTVVELLATLPEPDLQNFYQVKQLAACLDEIDELTMDPDEVRFLPFYFLLTNSVSIFFTSPGFYLSVSFLLLSKGCAAELFAALV